MHFLSSINELFDVLAVSSSISLIGFKSLNLKHSIEINCSLKTWIRSISAR